MTVYLVYTKVTTVRKEGIDSTKIVKMCYFYLELDGYSVFSTIKYQIFKSFLHISC